MAREENFEVTFLEEMPACLCELFEQTIYDEQKQFPKNVYQSEKSHKLTLSFNGKHLPLPMLTEEERAEMRQYRRKAVECEEIIFERRRQKYSSLVLQVMSVMDRIRIKRGRRDNTVDYIMNESERTLFEESSSLRSNNKQNSGMTDIMQQPSSSNFQSDFQDHSSERTCIWDGDVPCSGQGQISVSSADLVYRHDLHSSRVDSQMEYMLHSTESDLAACQRGMHRKASVEKNPEHPVLRDFDSRLESENCVRLEGMEFPLNSTLVKDTHVLNRTSLQYSLSSSGMSEVSYSLHKPLSPLHNREDLELDSLASSSLTKAFSESSISTVQSVVEMEPKVTAQRQLYMGAGTNEQKDYQQPYTHGSVKNRQGNHEANRKLGSQKQNKGKSSKTNILASSSFSSQDQDEALMEHLDKLKQKLQEEKQKQIQILKQQELVRLRVHKREQFSDLDGSKGKFHQRSSPKNINKRPHSMPFVRQLDYQLEYDQDSGFSSLSDGSFVHHEKSNTVPRHRPFSSSPGEMYSILERSGENLDAGTVDNITEDESSSDKENNVSTIAARRSRTGALNQEQDFFQNGLRRRDDRENLGYKYESKDQRISELDLRDKFSSQGREKFAKVSAFAKGFLTRLLLRTEKVHALIQTVKDTRDFLADISKEDSCSFQEKMLKENVESHLKGARCNLYDVFFTIPMKERMSYIAQSRNMAVEKKAKRAVESSGSQAKLSAVTLRAIQRRQEGLEQNPSRKCDTSGTKPKFDAQEERKRNKNWDIRVLKPQQSRSSPPLPDKTRSRKHNIRPTTAPVKPLNSRPPKQDSINRPHTTQNTYFNSKKGSRQCLGGGIQPTKRRLSVGGSNRQQKVTGPPTNANSNVQPRGQKKISLPESSQPRLRGPAGNDEVTQRPRTTSDVKRGSRTLAANFSK